MLSRLLSRLFLAVALLASFPVSAETLGEIPFQYRDGFLWLKVCAAGQREPLNFLLDSGASSSVLSIQAARRLNVKLGSPQSVHGVHSRTIAYRVSGFKAAAEGIILPESLLAIDLSGVDRTVHQPIDGLLGADFFRGRIVQIDFARRKVRVLDHAQPNGRSAVLPIKWYNDAICVPVGVAGNSSQWMRWIPAASLLWSGPPVRQWRIAIPARAMYPSAFPMPLFVHPRRCSIRQPQAK